MAKLRATEWLRLNLNINRPPTKLDEADPKAYVQMQREKVLKHAQINDLSDWGEVKSAFREACRHKGVTDRELNDRLRDLVDVSTRLIGGPARTDNLAETAATFILQMFHDSIYVSRLVGTSNDHKEHLATVFDPVNITSELVAQAYEQSRFLLKLVEDTPDMDFLFKTQANNAGNTALGVMTEMAQTLDTEWGPDLSSFDLDPFALPDDEESSFVTWDSIMSPTIEPEISFRVPDNGLPSGYEILPPQTSSRDFRDTRWLFSNLKGALDSGDMDVDCTELLEVIQGMLSSDFKSNEDIEADLLGLLGFSNLDLIREIIVNREELVRAHKSLFHQQQPLPSETRVMPRINPLILPDKKFRIGQSIVVQTEEEKMMQKLVRKAEKKTLKEISKEQREAGGNGFNLAELENMRRERELALLSAMSAPLFKAGSGMVVKQEQYPYVFDSYLEAKQSAAMVGGRKMVLPDGFKRKDDRKFEEMHIPAGERPPAHIVEAFKLIQIKDLDEIGQMGFQGMKQLNQIQSVVFETAYNTNENMLVCAPTGAGKTNIAMLTVLKVIRDNIDDSGKLHKDKFKIIYVAPMKALASEMTDNFSHRLKGLGIKVKELTGDMQLTRQQIMETQMIVTTPEKWDVVTRKAKGDANIQLVKLVRLIIIDEVHLLQSDRGPVLEALVARTIRYVEAEQKMIRLLGLSATLPNYVDVALFLSVSLNKGMFFFDSRFRPVPLELSFIGVKSTQTQQQRLDMDEVCYQKVKEIVLKGQQVMVFVHARNATYKLAQTLMLEAQRAGELSLFEVDSPEVSRAVDRTRNRQLKELLPNGFLIHHAGILRQDRNLVEKAFKDGLAKVLVCTSTLAWGVNLPAHAVIIRGTEIYDSAHGEFVDVSMLDVMQIFGRAGRPQYDTEGYACIITSHDKLSHYLSMLTNQYPIESNFIKFLADNLNAEIVGGTVSSIDEAVDWMFYTYLVIRMQRNPLAYGLTYEDVKNDPHLINERRKLAELAARQLHNALMIKYDEENERLDATDLGRTASYFYIKYDTIERFNNVINEDMEDDQILNMICQAQEFDQLKSREEEMNELMDLHKRACHLKVPGGIDSKIGKVNILLQAYLSQCRLESFSLISDSMFIKQNIVRMARGLFEYVLKSGWAYLAHKALMMAKMFERQMWAHQHPLRQFYSKDLDYDTLKNLDNHSGLSVDKLRDDAFTAKDIGHLARNASKGPAIKKLAHMLPWLYIRSRLQPIKKTFKREGSQNVTSHAIKVDLEIATDFTWNDSEHGMSQGFWIWLQDIEGRHIVKYEQVHFSKKDVVEKLTKKIHFSIPVLDPTRVPSQYVLHVDSDRWLGCNVEEDAFCEKLLEYDE